MEWVLIVMCAIWGGLAMPHHESGHLYGEIGYEKLHPTGSSPLRDVIPENWIYPTREELYNSEASPALPPLAIDVRPKPSPIISLTIPITSTTTFHNHLLDETTTTATTTTSTSTTTAPTTTRATTTTTTSAPVQQEQEPDKGVTESAASSPSTFILPIRGANPSVQLLPPEVNPTTPTTLSPRNLHDIPLSLVSLSGNSGATTSSEEDITKHEKNAEQMGVDFTKFRYHVETGKLVKIGSTGAGICPPNMRFFAVPGHTKNGACDCDYYQCSRPLIYSPLKHQCYFAWSQGPCNHGEWFIFDKDLRKRGLCVKNPCPPDQTASLTSTNTTSGVAASPSTAASSEYFFLNPDDETCYEAGTQGYCTDADERLLIFPGEPIPKCRKFTVCYPLTVPQELQCIFGNKYFVESGHC